MTPSDNSSQFPLLHLPGADHLEQDRMEADQMLATSSRSVEAYITAFEERIRTYTGSQFAIAFSSSSAGLRLCLQALGTQPGDLIITSSFADNTAVGILLSSGVVPVFVDVEPRTGNIDSHLVFAAAQDIMQGGKNAQAWLPPKGASIDARLKAILPVDVFGQTADLESLLNTAWKYKIKVIEDARETLGTAYKGRQAGALADFGIFNLYYNQEAPTTPAGILVTDEAQPAEKIFSLRDHLQSSLSSSSEAGDIHENTHPDPQTAALGLVYMRHLEERIALRKQVANWYSHYLSGIPGVEIPMVANHTTQMGWSVYVIRLAPGCDRELITQQLAARGIPVKPYHQPLHLQTDLMERFGYQQGTFPVAEDLGRRSLALPFSGSMQQGQVEQVCRALEQSI